MMVKYLGQFHPPSEKKDVKGLGEQIFAKILITSIMSSWKMFAIWTKSRISDRERINRIISPDPKPLNSPLRGEGEMKTASQLTLLICIRMNEKLSGEVGKVWNSRPANHCCNSNGFQFPFSCRLASLRTECDLIQRSTSCDASANSFS
jgi:hypothetical protein